jgi:hypothetical protein
MKDQAVHEFRDGAGNELNPQHHTDYRITDTRVRFVNGVPIFTHSCYEVGPRSLPQTQNLDDTPVAEVRGV